MSNLKQHAEIELKLAGLFDEDSDYGGELAKATIELIEVFSKQGHSGSSASMVSNLFNKLSRFETLQGLTGKDEEWGEPFSDDDMVQNKRDSAVFKHSDGTCTYNDAFIKRCPNGSCWSGALYPTREDALNNTNRIKVKIKSFPFTPKKFYIDVIEEEVKKDDWIMWVKDESQLKELFEYYERY
jgi:hypothetical protein